MPTQILRINAGADHPDSVTRALADEVIERLVTESTRVTTRDLTSDLPFVDGPWVAASSTGAQSLALATSDRLIDELVAADVVVLVAPVYNFGVPASLKAWVDQVARAGRTFEYTDEGPRGLITGTRAIVVTASGGMPIDRDVDFAVPYLRHVLGFLGITDVQIVAAEQLMARGDDAVAAARTAIERLTPLAA